MSAEDGQVPGKAGDSRSLGPQIEADPRSFFAQLEAKMAERAKIVSKIDAAQANVLSDSVAPLPFDEVSEDRARNERAGLTISRGHGLSQPWFYALDGVGRITFKTDDLWDEHGRRTMILVSLETYHGSCLMLDGDRGVDHAGVLSTLKSFLRRSHALFAADCIGFDPAHDNHIPVVFVDDFRHRAWWEPPMP